MLWHSDDFGRHGNFVVLTDFVVVAPLIGAIMLHYFVVCGF
jgi:hypothetical protein